ncbi:DUF6624 domain-containing protein [Haliscomenobacter sp.]|uniref:DUF6624 domain-containing protein n=1 Tax=Haliscomenobacter sp. TaxID=2717303 RepID=UPI003593B521
MCLRWSFLLLFSLTFSVQLWAQVKAPDAYYVWIKSADSLFKIPNYPLAAQHYSQAFKSFEGKGFMSDRYQAACAWARTGLADSAFFQLEKIVWKGKFDEYFRILADSNLVSLHTNTRWEPLITQVRRLHGIVDSLWNPNLYQLIDSMAAEDQKWRNRVTSLENTAPTDSIQVKWAVKMYNKVDSANYFVLRKIINTFGFPAWDCVGKSGANKFWLLVQHQDSQVEFQKEVLQLMEQKWLKGKVSAVDYAYLVDRVKVNTRELQVYGTQFDLNAERSSFTPKPVVDPANLNARREKMGLGTIESYMETANRRYYGTLKKEQK